MNRLLQSSAVRRSPFAWGIAVIAAVAGFLTPSGTATAAAGKTHRRQAPSTCAGARASVTTATRPVLQNAVVCLINQQRTSRGLPALAADSKLDRSAQGWTDQLVSQRELTHGADFAARISAVGFRWSAAGENIATGFDTPASVVAGWMGSIGHCENILDPSFREVGTGVSAGATFASPGTWTQDFGLMLGQRPASSDGGPAAGCPYS